MASNLDKLLKYLSSFPKIDFRGKESELGSLIEYDKDKNSIFDSNELESMRIDLSSIFNESSEETLEIQTQKVVEIGKQNLEDFKNQYLDKYSKKRDFTEDDIKILYYFDANAFKKAEQLLYIKNRDKQFNASDIIKLLRLNEEEFERAKQLFYLKNRDKQFNASDIVELSKLNEEEFERAKQLFYLENRRGWEIVELAKLNDEGLERAKQLFCLENRTGREIAKLAKLDNESFEHAKYLLYIGQFSATEIVHLAKLSNDDFKWISKFFSYKNLPFDNMMLLGKNHCKELEEYMDLNFSDTYSVNDSFKELKTDNCVKLKVFSDDNIEKYNTFNKTGIIETTEYEKIPNSESIVNGKKITCYNKNLKVKQETIIGDIPNTDDKEIFFSEVLTYFDDDGNVIRSVTTKRNPENGTLNVSETDKNGKQNPIQWESIDPNTGVKITERHLTAPEPDCTRTDCYFEENDNLKVSDYKITDKDGKVLINVHQTFEQVSENKFISSILATDDPNYTQIYEMEYTDDGIVKIFDKKNNKTTELDLNKYADNKETLAKLMPTIKQLPGQILLKYAEMNVDIKYKATLKRQAYGSNISIRMGNFDNTVNKDENLFSVFLHEFGHSLDYSVYTISDGYKIFTDKQQIKNLYQEESASFFKSTTSVQQKHMDYLLNCLHEAVADGHSILYSKDMPFENIRRLYLAQYFPRTIAATMKAMLEEEGVKVS